MKFIVNAGETANITRTITGEDGESLSPAVGYPRVRLLEGDDILGQWVATPLGGDEYLANVSVPQFDGIELVELTLQWALRTTDDDLYRENDVVQVNPDDPYAGQGEPVVLTSDLSFGFTVPHVLDAGTDTVTFQALVKNVLVGVPITGGDIQIIPRLSTTDIVVALPPYGDPNAVLPGLNPFLGMVTYTTGSLTHRTSFNMWMITPQILVAANMLDQWMNKAKIKNVIPGLRYETYHLLNYLSGGLNYFNSYGAILTAFTGINMQNLLLDWWIVCSAWYMLTSQYGAEGNHAFDFQGQAVSLTVDRTQFIETLIGHLENRIQNELPKLKALIGKTGITQGDGSQQIGAHTTLIGYTGLTRTPITQVPNNMGTW